MDTIPISEVPGLVAPFEVYRMGDLWPDNPNNTMDTAWIMAPEAWGEDDELATALYAATVCYRQAYGRRWTVIYTDAEGSELIRVLYVPDYNGVPSYSWRWRNSTWEYYYGRLAFGFAGGSRSACW